MPYVLEDETAKALREFGIPVDAPYNIWHCPSTDYWPRGWYPGELDRFHMDNYMILTWLRGQPGYVGSLSPQKVEDPAGPLLAEYTRWWNLFNQTWSSNHLGPDEVVAGHNQIWSDGPPAYLSRRHREVCRNRFALAFFLPACRLQHVSAPAPIGLAPGRMDLLEVWP